MRTVIILLALCTSVNTMAQSSRFENMSSYTLEQLLNNTQDIDNQIRYSKSQLAELKFRRDVLKDKIYKANSVAILIAADNRPDVKSLLDIILLLLKANREIMEVDEKITEQQAVLDAYCLMKSFNKLNSAKNSVPSY